MKLIAKKKSKKIYRHTLFYSPLCFVLCRHCNFFFCKLKITGNPSSNKFISSICATVFVSFLSLCHILVISTLFQSFFLLLYLLYWFVISDFWCLYCNYCWTPQTKLIYVGKLNQRVCSNCSANLLFPHMSPFPWAYLSPEI